jgi:DNA-binding MarR family transcriptional regulator
VLVAVEQHEGVSQTDLVSLTGIDRSTLAEMIRRMIEKGLLSRERTESDQRANAVHLAPGGRKTLRGARAANDRVEKTLLAALPAGDRAKFSRMLSTIVAAADEGEPAAPQAARRPSGRRQR